MQIAQIEKNLAKQLIIENHYSHKWTSCRYALGLFKDGSLKGCAIYGYPVGRRVVQSIAPELDKSEVLELTRLWLCDSLGYNSESWFIGQTFKWLRKNDPKIKVLIAYSDPLANHVGFIYQATNWLYQGQDMMLVKGFIHHVNGEALHPRTCVAKYGTIDTAFLRQIDANYRREPLKKKHRYLYVLDRKAKLSFKHLFKPYPKNNDRSDW
ncbi:MAG: hypothetical protein CV087_09785 [Candidatus Brocadia sp. WS118]|nr:MAG: hypothetical protein CV087_09785 [Candidatus Brocadia sp. WS118]